MRESHRAIVLHVFLAIGSVGHLAPGSCIGEETAHEKLLTRAQGLMLDFVASREFPEEQKVAYLAHGKCVRFDDDHETKILYGGIEVPADNFRYKLSGNKVTKVSDRTMRFEQRVRTKRFRLKRVGHANPLDFTRIQDMRSGFPVEHGLETKQFKDSPFMDMHVAHFDPFEAVVLANPYAKHLPWPNYAYLIENGKIVHADRTKNGEVRGYWVFGVTNDSYAEVTFQKAKPNLPISVVTRFGKSGVVGEGIRKLNVVTIVKAKWIEAKRNLWVPSSTISVSNEPGEEMPYKERTLEIEWAFNDQVKIGTPDELEYLGNYGLFQDWREPLEATFEKELWNPAIIQVPIGIRKVKESEVDQLLTGGSIRKTPYSLLQGN